MSKVEIIGFAPSTYVRVVRMVCEEKGIDYELRPLPPHSPRRDALAGAKHLSAYFERHSARPSFQRTMPPPPPARQAQPS
jgi:glutathione S-transferase